MPKEKTLYEGQNELLHEAICVMEKATEVRSPMKEHDDDDAVFGHYIATEIRAIDNN